MPLKWRVRFVQRERDDLDLGRLKLAESGVTPLRERRREVVDRRAGGVVADGHVGKIGIAGIRRDGDEGAKAVMDAGAPAVVIDVEERCVLKRVDAAETDRERGKGGNRVARVGDELVQPLDTQLVAAPWRPDDEPEFLQWNVEKVAGVEPDERELFERAPELDERVTEALGRHPDDTDREPAIASAPLRPVVASIDNPPVLPEVLPDAPVGLVLLGRDIRQPPERAAERRVPPCRSRSGTCT